MIAHPEFRHHKTRSSLLRHERLQDVVTATSCKLEQASMPLVNARACGEPRGPDSRLRPQESCVLRRAA
jgi:hypothetical protein